jgi:hypothetical protein
LIIYHNWYQLKTFLERIGFRQVPSRGEDLPEDFLYFRNDDTRQDIGFEKSEKISVPAVRIILRRIGLNYEYFVIVFYAKQSDRNASSTA